MAVIHKRCPECGRTASAIDEITMGIEWKRERWVRLSCGHDIVEKVIDSTAEIDDSPSSDGKTLYPFQREGVKFALASNVRCLFADEMGLGKTIQALRTISSRPKELAPFAVFCKSSVKMQWFKEILRWCGMDGLPQVLDDARTELLEGFESYIFSLDLLRRFNGKLQQQFKKIGIKTIIIDECQLIKNPTAQRTEAVRQLTKQVEHIVALSGTPIKNRASEYFPVLNILHPETFPRYNSFIWSECQIYYDSYGRPKVGGLRDPEGFFEKTKQYIIRREREQVMPELPRINRQYRFSELGEQVAKAYEQQLGEFIDYWDGCSGSERGGFAGQSNILAYLSRMRHLTGLAKVVPTTDFVEDFLDSTQRQIVIFCHHQDVHQLILNRLQDYCKHNKLELPLSLTSDVQSDVRSRTQLQFLENPTKRVLVASLLAFGEGLNLQSAADCIIVERQWNPANEEQAECRFVRIGQKASQVNSTYMIAVGTVDEFLTEIVEKKREIVAQTLGGKEVDWNESEIIRELAQMTADKGRKAWKP